MREIVKALASGPHLDERIEQLQRKYAISALSKPQDLPFTDAIQIAQSLAPTRDVTDENRFGHDRTVEATCWLRAWKILNDAIDPNWNPNVKGDAGPLMPPKGVLRGGNDMSPSAIADPDLRAQYEAAIEARRSSAQAYIDQLDARKLRDSFKAVIERNLIDSYSQRPAGGEELKALFERFGVEEPMRAEISQGLATGNAPTK